MRLRIFLSFFLIVIVTVASVWFIAARRTTTDIQQFVSRGGLTGTEPIVKALEDYYQIQQTWEGVEQLFASRGGPNNAGAGSGTGPGPRNPGFNQRLRLADADGILILDTRNPDIPPGAPLSSAELETAITLYNGRNVVGYLVPEFRPANLTAIELSLLERINSSTIPAAVIAGLFSLGIAIIFAYVLLRPIRALTWASAELAKGDLSQRVPVRGSDELANLGRTFNHMAASLQQAEQRRKALTADIAHELRNPLAVQRANLEALQDGVYPMTAENLTPILQQTVLLERLVEDLRTLALADAGQIRLDRVPTDLPRLLQGMLNELEPEAGARSINLKLHHHNTCPELVVDPARIKQIVGNLLSNALKHTPDGGHIRLELSCTPQHARLTVHDSGPGIPPEDIPYLFDRFFRGDRARTRTEGSTGLGLSIARRLAEAHNGTLEAANHPNGGAVFTLTLYHPG